MTPDGLIMEAALGASAKPLLGAIEGGGTKIVCAIGHSPAAILDRLVIPTRDPTSTLAAAVDFFVQGQLARGRLDAFGIAFFGPIDLRRERPTYGRLLNTPKAGWSGVDVVKALAGHFPVPIAVDTDVNAAALAEWEIGTRREVASLAYVTVGTGIGAGFAPYPEKSTRLLHPEAGHLPVRRAPLDDDFRGVCPFHGDCLEGLASGSAIQARWGCDLNALPPEHPAWTIIGGYLGQLATAITLVASVERIVFGGGVMAEGALLPHIRAATQDCLRGYIGSLNDGQALDRYIQRPALAQNSGIAGAFLLAAAGAGSIDE